MRSWFDAVDEASLSWASAREHLRSVAIGRSCVRCGAVGVQPNKTATAMRTVVTRFIHSPFRPLASSPAQMHIVTRTVEGKDCLLIVFENRVRSQYLRFWRTADPARKASAAPRYVRVAAASECCSPIARRIESAGRTPRPCWSIPRIATGSVV